MISQRSKGEAVEMLEDIWEELDQLSGTQRASRFAELAREVSDCGSAREGGDLGELDLSTMAEEFEAAFLSLGVGDLSDVLETDSGLHVILRTVATSSYRMLHVLIKHQGSARQASWQDPEGTLISERTPEAAETTLHGLLGQVQSYPGAKRADRFAALAGEVSDCGSAREGGDLGVLHAGDMDEEFESAVLGLPVWGLSGVIGTDSGSHIILRTPMAYARKPAAKKTEERPEDRGEHPELQGLGAELRTQKISVLKLRAQHAGVPLERVEAAIDDADDDPTASVIGLILDAVVALRAELMLMKMGELKARAAQAGIDREKIEVVIDDAEDNPKAEVIQLVMNHVAQPSELPDLEEEKKKALAEEARAQAAAEEAAARVAAEEAEAELLAAKQAAEDAQAAAAKELEKSEAAAAAAAVEEAEAVAAEEAHSKEEAEAVAAEATANKEAVDVRTQAQVYWWTPPFAWFSADVSERLLV